MGKKVKRRWVKCKNCGYMFKSGVKYPTCSQCKKRKCKDMKLKEIEKAVESGDIDHDDVSNKLLNKMDDAVLENIEEEEEEDNYTTSSGRVKRKRPSMSSKKSLKLDPATQSLFQYEIENGKGKMYPSDWINHVIQQYYKRVVGVEPAMVRGDISGQKSSFILGNDNGNSSNTDDIIDKLHKERANRLRIKEIENMATEDELNLMEKQKRIEQMEKSDNINTGNNNNGNSQQQPNDVDSFFDYDKMIQREMRKAQLEDFREERALKNQEKQLRLEKMRAEIEQLRNQDNGKKSGDDDIQKTLMTLMLKKFIEGDDKSGSHDIERLEKQINEKIDKMNQQTQLEKIREESREREKRYQEQMEKLSQEKQNMVFNEILRRQEELESQTNAPDKLDLLNHLKDEVPWMFGKSAEEQFNPEKKEMELQERVMDKGLSIADKASENLSKRADRAGKIVDKVIDSSLDRMKHDQKYQKYQEEDLEKMYDNIKKGDESSFFREEIPDPKVPQTIENPSPEDYYEEPQPQPQPQPQPVQRNNNPEQPTQEPQSKKSEPIEDNSTPLGKGGSKDKPNISFGGGFDNV